MVADHDDPRRLARGPTSSRASYRSRFLIALAVHLTG
jgi:hypothetical protein